MAKSKRDDADKEDGVDWSFVARVQLVNHAGQD